MMFPFIDPLHPPRRYSLEEAKALLDKAQSRRRLDHPGRLERIANALDQAHLGRLHKLSPAVHADLAARKSAQKLVKQLGPLMTQILSASYERRLRCHGSEELQIEMDAAITRELNLFTSVLGLDLSTSVSLSFPEIWDWHMAARTLWGSYRDTVGHEHSTSSGTGPASRFVHFALLETGYGNVREGTIEKHLNSWWPELASPKRAKS